ncbi:Uncharacterised protein [Achromobacter sp. 2789STDY5608621]|nr:Uncharacterised protein [Achromobacter sp. 2789STDY5608621]
MTSMVPTMTPMAAIMAVSWRIRGTPNTDDSRPASRGCTAGAVARCSTKAVTPRPSSSAAPSGPASGNRITHSPTASGGPMMKLNSSNTDSSA